MRQDSHASSKPASFFPSLVAILCCLVGLILLGLGGASYFWDFKIFDFDKKPAANANTAVQPTDAAPLSADSVIQLHLEADPALIAFKETELHAKAGAKLEITFKNPSPMPHNVIFGKKDSQEALTAAANAMMTDPDGMKKSYIPDSPLILGHSKLISQGQSEVVSFQAPNEPGEYPYLCSFPGHPMIMHGKLILAAPSGAAAPAPAATSATDGVIKLNLEADPALIAFKETELHAKAGAKLEITFKNPSPMPHNVIFGKKDSQEALTAAANTMMTDPDGMKKSYIPDSPLILGHSKLISQGQSEVVSFQAPNEPGEYPYLCSFPGHPMIMHGKLILE